MIHNTYSCHHSKSTENKLGALTRQVSYLMNQAKPNTSMPTRLLRERQKDY